MRPYLLFGSRQPMPTIYYLVLPFLAGTLCCVYLAFRRLVLHPLSRFPGPPLAAITTYYKSYYDVAKGGRWLHHLGELHDKYGNVVRVGPNELHFKDRRVYDRIFSLNSHLTKEPGFYACFGVGESTFGTIDPIQAKDRRDLLAPYFDKRAVIELEDVIRESANLLVTRLSTARLPTDMFYGFRCATMDIITTHCFGRSSRSLQEQEFKAPIIVDIQTAVPLLWTLKSFPWLLPLLPWLPRHLGLPIKRQFNAFIRLQEFVCQGLQHVHPEKRQDSMQCSPPIFKSLSDTSPLLYGDKSRTHLVHEALSLIQAGSDTVANTCVVGFFHVLDNPSIHARLVCELNQALPDLQGPFTRASLEKVPYLTAVIKESLRMSHGFVTPFPRVVGQDGADFLGWEIPPGTVVGTGVTFIHTDPEIFPRPDEFCPQRWLDPAASQNKYLMPFSRGTRMCLGINMAWTELYLIFGTLFRKLDMVLVNTSVLDVKDFNDYFVPIYTGRHLHIQAKARST